MPLLAFLAEMLHSGNVTVAAKNVEIVKIKAADKKIDVDALNKEFLKDALAAARKKGESSGFNLGQLKAARSGLGMLKEAAEELSDEGITVTLSYQGKVVVTMGAQAKPKLSSLATGTKAIEINSPLKLVELGL